MVCSINNSGVALVSGMSFPFGREAIVWDTNSGAVRPVLSNAIPVFIGSEGQMGAIGYRASGEQCPLISYGHEWQEVAVNDGFSPSTANDSLTLAGQVYVDGFPVAWSKRKDG